MNFRPTRGRSHSHSSRTNDACTTRTYACMHELAPSNVSSAQSVHCHIGLHTCNKRTQQFYTAIKKTTARLSSVFVNAENATSNAWNDQVRRQLRAELRLTFGGNPFRIDQMHATAW
jgi:hypothetical protein